MLETRGNGNDYLDGGAGNDVMRGYGGDDTYAYQSGNDVIEDTGGYNVIEMDTGITSSDVSLHIARYENATIDLPAHMFLNVDGRGTITIQKDYNPYNNLANMIALIEYADTSTQSFAAMDFTFHGTNNDDSIDTRHGFSGEATVYGYEGNDTLYNVDLISTLDGGAGDDYLRGGSNSDTFIISAGLDTISETGGSDTIVLPSGFDLSDVSFIRAKATASANDYREGLIVVDGLGSIAITNLFSHGEASIYAVETLDITDAGTVNLLTQTYEVIGTDGDDYITDFSAWSNKNDVYVFGLGNDVVYEQYGGTDTVKFGAGITINDLEIYRQEEFSGIFSADYQNLVIEDAFGNSLTIKKHFSDTDSSIEKLEFDNSTIIDISSLEIETRGTSGNDVIEGVTIGDASEDDTIYGGGGDDALWGYSGDDTLIGEDGNDRLYGGADNDTLTGGDGVNILEGGTGNDTYAYVSGFEKITDDGGTADKITLAQGITSGDVSIYSVAGTDHLLIDIHATGLTGQIFVYDHFDSSGDCEIETLELYNQTSITITTSNAVNELYGTLDADTINGDQSGTQNDIIRGFSGNDILNGGLGDDTYYYASGEITITDTGGSADKIILAEGITSGDLSFYNVGANDLRIVINGNIVGSILIKDYNLSSSNEIETLQLYDTTTVTISASNTSNEFYGTAGNDVISADYDSDDVLIGLGGDDTLSGRSGSDTYVWSVGDGNDTIYENQGTNDTLKLQGVAFEDIRFEKSSYHLKIHINETEAITINEHLRSDDNGGTGYNYRIVENILLDDSTLIDISGSLDFVGTSASETVYGLESSASQMYGLAGNDNLLGGDGADLLVGGLGNDTLQGGKGNDVYEWVLGDGNDTINEGVIGTLTDVDTLRLYQVDADDFRFELSNREDLNIYINETEVITIDRQHYSDKQNSSSNDYYKVENIILDDATSIDISAGLHFEGTSSSSEYIYGLKYISSELSSAAGNDNMYGGEADDVFHWSVGDGNDKIYDDGGYDILKIHGVASEDIRLVRDGSYNLKVFIGSESITLDGQLYSDFQNNSYYDSDKIDMILFDDNTSIDISDYLTFTGTSGNDSITGYYNSDARLIGMEGNDNMYGGDADDVLIGGLGNDTLNGYDGNDTYFWNIGDGNDTISDDGGTDILRLQNVVASEITFEKSGNFDLKVKMGSETITLKNQMRSDYTNNSTYDYYKIESILLDDNTAFDLTGALPITGTYADDTSLYGYQNENNIIYGLEGNDTLYGASGNDSFYGGLGNDTINGYDGDDLYYWFSGDGNDTIYENASQGTDKLIFGSNIVQSDVRTWISSTEDLHIKIMPTNEKVIIFGSGFVTDIGTRFETIEFSDSSTWDLTQGLYLNDTDDARTQYGTDYGDAINGNGGNDTIHANGGDDILIGGDGADALYGGSGNDTADYSTSTGGVIANINNGQAGNDGFGNLDTFSSIENLTGSNHNDILYGDEYVNILIGNAGNDTLRGRAGDDYIYGNDGADTLIGDEGNDLLNGGAGDDDISGDAGVDTVSYEDATGSVTVSLLSNTSSGADGADTLSGIENITGSDYADTLTGDTGNNVILGGAGNDIINGGTGNDTLDGGNGDDYIYGNNGDDIIMGGLGEDTLYGYGDADTFKVLASHLDSNVDTITDFDTGEGDKIDIADLLDLYDPMSDVITDFVQITDDGTDSFLAVDLDGGADNFVQILTIEANTGLTDEAALVTSGNLIVV